MGIDSLEAAFPIYLILSSDIEMLDDVMQEQDISPVPWITKPAREVTSPRIEHMSPSRTAGSIQGSGEASPRTPPFVAPSRTTNLFDRSSGTTPFYEDHLSPPRWQIDSGIGTPEQTSQYRDLLDHIIARANGSRRENEVSVWDLSEMRRAIPTTGQDGQVFDRDTTFRERNRDKMAQDRKFGAAGELFVGIIKVWKHAAFN